MMVDFIRTQIVGKDQVLIMMIDNSAIRQREKALMQSDMQKVFFASVAHDLRTPLNSMLASNASLIQMVQK